MPLSKILAFFAKGKIKDGQQCHLEKLSFEPRYLK